jgi:phage baseplate assembly protein W
MSFDLKIKNGDLSINNAGVIEPVIGNEKLRQDILKVLITDSGSNRYHPKYGSFLGKLKIGGFADDRIVSLDIEKSVRNAVEYLMALQKAQSQRQSLSAGEVIAEVLKVGVSRDEVDPRAYNVFVSVLTGELTEITTSLAIKIA